MSAMRREVAYDLLMKDLREHPEAPFNVLIRVLIRESVERQIAKETRWIVQDHPKFDDFLRFVTH